MPVLRFDLIVNDKGSVAMKRFGEDSEAAFRRVEKAANKLTLEALPAQERAVVSVKQHYSKLNSELLKLERTGRISKDIADQWKQALDVQMSQSLKNLESEGKRRFKHFADYAKAAATAFATAAVAMAGREIYQATIGMERMENALRSATGSGTQAAAEIAFVRQEANRLGLELITAGEGFVTISAAAKGTTLAGKGVRDIFSAVSEASAVLSLSADKTAGALLAISQMISKGKVSAEELRGQLGERLPGAYNAAARAMRVTTSELDNMLQKGQIMAEDFLPKFAVELHKTFGPDLETAAGRSEAAFNRLKNSITGVEVAIGQSGIIGALAAAADFAAQSILGWQGLLSAPGTYGKGLEMFSGEALETFKTSDLYTRQRMIQEQSERRAIVAKSASLFAADPYTQIGSFLPEGSLESEFSSKNNHATDKDAALRAKLLADQWVKTRAELAKEVRLKGLSGLDKELEQITMRAMELRIQFGNNKEIDEWADTMSDAAKKARAAMDAAKWDETLSSMQIDVRKLGLDDLGQRLIDIDIQVEKLHKHLGNRPEIEAYAAIMKNDAIQKNFDAAKKSLDSITLAALPEQERAVESLRLEYKELHDQLLKSTAAGVLSRGEADKLHIQLGLRQAEALANMDKNLGQMSEFARASAENMQSAFAYFLFDPFSDGIEGMVVDFGNAMRRIAAEAAAAQVMEKLMGADYKGGSGTGWLSTAASFASSYFGGTPSFNSADSAATGNYGPMPNARGNAFLAGSIVPFASGGIFDTPTYFPMASGKTGLLGEAGAEAIMPLTRTRDGKLGVAASGGTNKTITINVPIHMTPDQAPMYSRTAGQIGRRVAVAVDSAMRRNG